MLGSKERPRPEPTCMSGDQMGQHSHQSTTHQSMAHKPSSPSRLRECQTHDYTSSPQKPTTAEYLSGLRKYRVERPTGSRPAPPSRFESTKRPAGAATDVQPTTDARPVLHTTSSMPVMEPARPAQQHHVSSSSIRSPFAGRPVVRPPSQNGPRAPSPTREQEPQPTVHRTPSMTYTERGSRWMEKQEAHSIRQAMEDMALQEEQKIHEAARDEAAELVWRHQNPQVADNKRDSSIRPNPDLKKDYRSHLRKGSYRRSVDQNPLMLLQQRSESRSSSNSSTEDPSGRQPEDNSTINASDMKTRNSISNRKISPPSMNVSVPKTRTPSGPSYAGLAEAVANDIAKAHRRSSSGGSSRRILSGEKKLFMHPDDKIWEDPDEEATPKRTTNPKSSIMEETTRRPDVEVSNPVPQPEQRQAQPTYVRKNPFARVRMQAAKLERSQSDSIVSDASPRQHNRVEIQRNPPSQSRNPFYVSNVALPPTPPPAPTASDDEVAPKDAPLREGKEIRGDDIRAATSKSRSDYSANLPRPTVVSDKPGRPIVSFEEDWKPKEMVMESMGQASKNAETAKPARTSLPAVSPSSRTSASAPPVVFHAPTNPGHETSQPPIPKIHLSDDSVQSPIPTINFPDDVPSIPSVSIQSDDAPPKTTNTTRPPMPKINVSAPSINVSGPTTPGGSSSPSRTSPHHAATSPTSPRKSTPHYSPSTTSFPRNSGALCAQCALPIAGRILSALGERFHPSCFNCHQCGTNLELVAFYPEPENKRAERLATTDPNTSNTSNTELDSLDPSPRFYCHLDFHELFSPRCKSCRTPIEGEVIVACGAEWHVGHFFCAQCGDPFDSSMPFVEKDGFAWCVGCHTNRYSAKCRKCRKPVTETVVKALGAEWHQGCFVCVECNCEFSDGRFFLRDEEQDPVCVACEERRLKA